MDKNLVVLDNLSKMPITKGERNIVNEAVNANEPSKVGKKVIDYAYRYALLIETNVANSRRGEKYLNGLKKCCLAYVDEKQKEISR